MQKTFISFNIHTQAFDQVPRDVVWWALEKLDIQEWLVKIVQSMYRNAQSRFFFWGGGGQRNGALGTNGLNT